ncbi:MAG: SIS domain-containing protein [Pseudomonadota bacterium]
MPETEAPLGKEHGWSLMRRELEDQPQLLARIAAALDAAVADTRPARSRTIWAGGCGDSLFAADALAAHFRAAGYRFRAASAAEMLWNGEISPEDAVVAVSISGTTRRTVEGLATARTAGARTIAVTINPKSPLSEVADATLLLPYTPISRAIPHGLDYHVTLLALATLAAPISGAEPGALFAEATDAAMAQAATVADSLGPNSRFVFLGGGPAAKGTAAFAAAKMQEAGGLPAWSFEAENFTHGAQFMLRPGDIVGLFGAGGPADARTRALRDGLDRLGCHVIEAGFENPQSPHAPLRAALLGGLAAQALCLAISERLDLDVMDPAQGSGADLVQKDWFSWQS